MIWNPWVILGILAASIAAIGGSYFYGVGVGKDKVEVKWQTREAKITAESAVKIAAADARVRGIERRSAEDIASVSAVHQAKLKEKDIEKDRAIAGVRAGTIRLRDPGARAQACRDPVPSTGTSASGHNGETGAELSGPTSEFLVSEASRADKIVEQLTACQAVIEKDRSIK